MGITASKQYKYTVYHKSLKQEEHKSTNLIAKNAWDGHGMIPRIHIPRGASRRQ